MKTKGFLTTKENVIFKKNDSTFIYLKGKNIIAPFTSYNGRTTWEQCNDLPCIDFDIEDIEAVISEKTLKIARETEIREAVMTILSHKKLSVKEKNKLKKDLQNKDAYYLSCEVTDSFRRTGGYYKYITSNIGRPCYMQNNEVFDFNGNLIISKRKKNYQLPKSVEFKEFIGNVIKIIEAGNLKKYNENAKKHNAELYLSNVELFKSEIIYLLTK